MRRFARLAAIALLAASLSPAAGSSSVHAIPLKGKAPAWYTHELHARVIAAGDRGLRMPDSIAVPATSLAFLGIRPGQLILVDNGDAISLCSSNFVFYNGANRAIGTAGHCGNVGDTVTMVVAPQVLLNIGTITKSTGDAGIGNDFALISIKPTLTRLVSASMPYWGGPTGPYKTPNKVPSLVKHEGWGLVVGTGGTPRVGVGSSYSTSDYTFIGAITFGDSGSGALAGNGQALGNITHIFAGIDNRGLHTAAGTSIARILQIAGLPLATCANIPWPFYNCPQHL